MRRQITGQTLKHIRAYIDYNQTIDLVEGYLNLMIRWLLRLSPMLIIVFTVFIFATQSIGQAIRGEILSFASTNADNVHTVSLLDTRRSLVIELFSAVGPNLTEYALSDDGAYLAIVSERDKFILSILNLQTGECLIISESSNGMDHLTWSPDSQMLAYVSPNEQIQVVDREGNPQRTIWNDFLEFQPVWSPDSTRIGFTADYYGESEVYIMNFDGSHPHNLSQSTQNSDRDPAWSNDGNYLAYFTHNYRSSLRIVDLTTGESNRLNLGIIPPIENFVWSSNNTHLLATGRLEPYLGDIYVVDIDAERLTNLASTIGSGWTPIWSSETSRIFFVSNPTSTYHIYSVNPDGTDLRCITCDLVPNASRPAFVP